MCGKRVADLRFDRRGLSQKTEKKVKRADERDIDDGGYGTSERFKKQKTEAAAPEAAAPEAAPEPVVDEAAERKAREAQKHESAMDAVSNAIARNQGRTINDADNPANDYKLWASATDAGSGKTYYYNSQTRQTSWVWPPAPVS